MNADFVAGILQFGEYFEFNGAGSIWSGVAVP